MNFSVANLFSFTYLSSLFYLKSIGQQTKNPLLKKKKNTFYFLLLVQYVSCLQNLKLAKQLLYSLTVKRSVIAFLKVFLTSRNSSLVVKKLSSTKTYDRDEYEKLLNYLDRLKSFQDNFGEESIHLFTGVYLSLYCLS
jgi:hypothetical protein